MYVKTYASSDGKLWTFVDKWPRPDNADWRLNECQWIVPGTVDPRDD